MCVGGSGGGGGGGGGGGLVVFALYTHNTWVSWSSLACFLQHITWNRDTKCQHGNEITT